MAKNFIWTTLKVIFSIFRFFCTLRFQIFKYYPIITNHTSMQSYLFSFQMMHKSQFRKIDPYDWFCAPGSDIMLTKLLFWMRLIAINRLTSLIITMQNLTSQWIWTTTGNYVTFQDLCFEYTINNNHNSTFKIHHETVFSYCFDMKLSLVQVWFLVKSLWRLAWSNILRSSHTESEIFAR